MKINKRKPVLSRCFIKYYTKPSNKNADWTTNSKGSSLKGVNLDTVKFIRLLQRFCNNLILSKNIYLPCPQKVFKRQPLHPRHHTLIKLPFQIS